MTPRAYSSTLVMTDGYLRWLEEHGYSRTTTRQYARTIRHAETWLTAHRYPALRRADWTAIRDLADHAPLSHASRAALRNAVSAYMRYVHRKPLPAGAIPVPSRPTMRSRAIDRTQLEAVLKAAKTMGPQPYAAACLAYYAALRRAEVVRVKWEDIRGDTLYVVGKGLKEAWVPIHPTLDHALRVTPRSPRWVLASPRRSGHIADGTLNLWFNAIALATGVPVSPHVLRHTAITEGHDATTDLGAAQTFARHSDPRVTMGYSRTSERRVRRLVAAL